MLRRRSAVLSVKVTMMHAPSLLEIVFQMRGREAQTPEDPHPLSLNLSHCLDDLMTTIIIMN